jgi:hypothetical protein
MTVSLLSLQMEQMLRESAQSITAISNSTSRPGHVKEATLFGGDGSHAPKNNTTDPPLFLDEQQDQHCSVPEELPGMAWIQLEDDSSSKNSRWRSTEHNVSMSLQLSLSPLTASSRQDMEREYDRDTWRLYNRIYSFRCNGSTENPKRETDVSSSATSSAVQEHIDNSQELLSSKLDPSELLDDAIIFDLEC